MLDAALPTYNTIVIALLAKIDVMLHAFVLQGYGAVSDYMRKPLGAISAIYIVILGYSMVMGWKKVEMKEFVKVCLQIGFIYMAVTNWGWIEEYFVGFINSAISGLGGAISKAAPINIPGASDVETATQVVLTQFSKIGNLLFRSGGITNLGPLFSGVVIWGFGYIVTAVALAEIIFSKVMLSVLFILTPFVVVFCYFKAFHGIFDRWLGAIIGAALLQLFVTAVLAMDASLCYWWILLHKTSEAMHIGNLGTLPIVIIGVVSIFMILKASAYATSIGGGVTTASGSALLAGVVGGAVGSTLGGLRFGGKALGAAGNVTKGLTNLGTKSSGNNKASESIMSDVKTNLRQGD